MIIFDAMDECKQNKDLSNAILNNLQHLPKKIKIFVSTRPGIFDNDKLTNNGENESKCKLYKLDVNDNRNKQDLINVLDHCLSTRYPTLSKENKDKIIKILEDKSQGTFLWVRYAVGILERISDGTHTASSKDITPEYIDKEIPNGLDDMYRYLLNPLKEYLGNDKFNKAFSTILASRVPLNIDIWKQIIGYADTDDNSNNNNKGEIEFMKLKREFNHLFLFGDDVVRVVHKSQTEYLEESEHGLSNGLRINRVNGHKYLGLLCDEISNKYCDEYYHNKHQRPLKLPDYVDDHASFSIEHSGYHLVSMVDIDDKEVSNKEKLIELSSNYLLDLKKLILRIHLSGARNMLIIISDCMMLQSKIKSFASSSSLPTNIEGNLKMMLQLLRFEGTSKTLRKDALSFIVMIQARTINSPAAIEFYKKSEEYLEQIMKVKYWKPTRSELDQVGGDVILNLIGHSSRINSVAISPDGKYALTGSDDNTAKYWDLQTGNEFKTLNGHFNDIYSVAISSDGKYALTGSGDFTARYWDLQTGNELKKLRGHSYSVSSVAISPDGKYALTGAGDNTARYWDLQTGNEIKQLRGHSSDLYAVFISSDGKYALTGAGDYTVRYWDLQTGNEIKQLIGHSWNVNSVAISSDGKYALTGAGDYTARYWDIQTGNEIKRFSGHSNRVMSVAITLDGKYALTGSDDNTIKYWDLQTGNEIKTLIGHSDYVKSAVLSADGRYALSGSHDKTAKYWDLQAGNDTKLLDGHSGMVKSVVLSADGRYALTGSSDNTAKYWDLRTGNLLKTFSGHRSCPYAFAISEDGKYGVIELDDSTRNYWDLQTGNELKSDDIPELDYIPRSKPSFDIAFKPNGKLLLLSDDIIGLNWDLYAPNSELSTYSNSSLFMVDRFAQSKVNMFYLT